MPNALTGFIGALTGREVQLGGNRRGSAFPLDKSNEFERD